MIVFCGVLVWLVYLAAFISLLAAPFTSGISVLTAAALFVCGYVLDKVLGAMLL